jgi:ABC-type phosphate transport system permease subunit
VIMGFAIGFLTNHMPAPLFDILERMSPLASSIVGLASSGFARGQSGPVLRSMGSFAGLLLLIIAFVILGVSAYLQSRLRKRHTL